MRIYKINEVVIVSDNKPGALHNVASAIASAGINIESITAYSLGRNAVFRIVTADPETTRKKAMSVKGVKSVNVNPVLVVKLPDRPGELAKLTDKISRRGIDLEALYILSKEDSSTQVALKPVDSQFEKLAEVLEG